MILWDRIRKNFDSGVEVVRRVAVALSERVRIESAVARLMVDKGGIETKMDRTRQIIGDRVHYLWAQGAEEIMKDTEVLDSLKELSDLNDRVNELTINIKKASLGELED